MENISCKISLLLIVFFSIQFANAQTNHFTEAYNEVQKQKTMSAYPTAKWDSLRCAWYGECKINDQPQNIISTCPLVKRMFGWHAIGTSSSGYQWPLLTDLSYFSYQVNPSTGNAINSSQMTAFPADATVTTAIANGVKVTLCATLFNNTNEFSTFFGNASAQTTLINNLINLVISANANGINIDFEGAGLNTTYVTQFTSFMSTLSTQLHNSIPNSELSIDLQGSFANSSALLNPLISSVDLFILMGYDYYWGGQFYPGPVAPTYQFPAGAGDPNGHGSVSNDLNYLIKNVGTAKVLLAMPYYGRRWRTTNGCVIPATGNAASLSTQTYSQFRQNSNGYYTNILREVNTFNAWHCFIDASAILNEQFIDDTVSLQKKYDLIKQRGIAGAAVWRLGYDAGYNDCWNLANNNLSNCSVTPAFDTLYDMGGPTGNYHNNENYTFTIAPPAATSVTLSFLSFDVELNFDFLKIYDGGSTSSPLIGNFTGNTIPASVTATSGVMTIQFHSDGATTKPGYKVVYTSSACPSLKNTISSGNWNDPTTWACGTVPSINDSVEILSNHSITLNASAQIKYLAIKPNASLNINDASVMLTIGNSSSKTTNVGCDGSLNITNGTMIIYGNLIFGGNYNFNLAGGKLSIDGNSGVAETSVADGQFLFSAAVTSGTFNFSGGILQFINPPFGANSEAINCIYNFGMASTLLLGDGISTIISNHLNGFGGFGIPDQIGELTLDAATIGNNRVFKVVKPLTINKKCEVKSGNLIQAALIIVNN